MNDVLKQNKLNVGKQASVNFREKRNNVAALQQQISLAHFGTDHIKALEDQLDEERQIMEVARAEAERVRDQYGKQGNFHFFHVCGGI